MAKKLLAGTTFPTFTTFFHHLLRPLFFRNGNFSKTFSKTRVLAVWVVKKGGELGELGALEKFVRLNEF